MYKEDSEVTVGKPQTEQKGQGLKLLHQEFNF